MLMRMLKNLQKVSRISTNGYGHAQKLAKKSAESKQECDACSQAHN
jgi:hypothetical protein